MRSIRLASLAIAAAVMSACSNDLTAPVQNVPAAPSPTILCSGFLLSSGRCEASPMTAAPTGTTTGTTIDKTIIRGTKPVLSEPMKLECSGFLLSSGRCE